MVPDFGSTAHVIQGATLDALFAECVNRTISDAATEEHHVAAYVMLSRAKYLENIWVLQAFGPQDFRQGEPAGPSILMDGTTVVPSTKALSR